ncbi:MAG: type II secretion system protein [Candidatus Ozemobacteraceae bacterium]
MNKSAFTLIELMIVIAIMSIIAAGLFPGVMGLQRFTLAQNAELQRQETILKAFHAFHRAFEEAGRVDWVQEDQLLLHGEETWRLQLVKKGGGVQFERPGGIVAIDFSGGMRVSGFQMVDGKSVKAHVEMNGAEFPMYWRCGR